MEAISSTSSLSRMPYLPPTLELRCLIDFTVSPIGALIGRQFTWRNILHLCQSLKDQTEVYPGRDIDIAADLTHGVGLMFLIGLSVYSGCNLVCHNVADIEKSTTDWVRFALPNIRDVFISASIARRISMIHQKALDSVKIRHVRSFNGK